MNGDVEWSVTWLEKDRAEAHLRAASMERMLGEALPRSGRYESLYGVELIYRIRKEREDGQ